MRRAGRAALQTPCSRRPWSAERRACPKSAMKATPTTVDRPAADDHRQLTALRGGGGGRRRRAGSCRTGPPTCRTRPRWRRRRHRRPWGRLPRPSGSTDRGVDPKHAPGRVGAQRRGDRGDHVDRRVRRQHEGLAGWQVRTTRDLWPTTSSSAAAQTRASRARTTAIRCGRLRRAGCRGRRGWGLEKQTWRVLSENASGSVCKRERSLSRAAKHSQTPPSRANVLSLVLYSGPMRIADLPPAKNSAARERLLDTAAQIFYAEGINTVGVNRIVGEAGVTLVTFYRHFPSKQDLVLAYLQRVHDDFVSRAAAAQQAAKDARDVVSSIATNITAQLLEPGFRGCAFINAASEFDDPDGPVLRAVLTHRAWFYVARPRRVRLRRPPAARPRSRPRRDAARRGNDSRTPRRPLPGPQHLRTWTRRTAELHPRPRRDQQRRGRSHAFGGHKVNQDLAAVAIAEPWVSQGGLYGRSGAPVGTGRRSVRPTPDDR